MASTNSLCRFLGDGPYPFPIEKVEDYLELYMNNDICVCRSKCPVHFNEDIASHYHSSYEFIIPSNPMPYIAIEKNILGIDSYDLMPINTCQQHGPQGSMSLDSLLAIHIDKNFLHDISHDMVGTSNIYFDFTPLPYSDDLQNLVQNFMNEAKYKQTGYNFMLDSLSTQMAVILLRNAKYNFNSISQPKVLQDNKNMNRVIDFFREHYNSNDYSSAEVAKLANLSTYHFIRVFKQKTGQTPYEYLMDIKIEKAKEMLKNKNHTIIEICFACGFSNHSHFTTTFKKKSGVTPSEYRTECILK
ncbi:MAG: hypothetical protein K0S75_2557 [Clostridia bacterium]|nr:hypothetical protein [Clostridia bacterium]